MENECKKCDEICEVVAELKKENINKIKQSQNELYFYKKSTRKGEMMNKKEAIQAMLDGKRVRQKTWDANEYIRYSDEDDLIINSHKTYFDLNDLNYYDNKNWVIYEEPKKKVKMWQWIIRYRKDNPRLTVTYYENELDALHEYSGYDSIQRADWTEIEIEVD